MNARHGLWAVVPVKLFAQTKRRLMPLLASHERDALARAMLADVLSALARTRSLAGTLVITGDAEAAATARAAGASVLADAENAGTSAAVTLGAAHLAGAGREGMLVIPADVPLITPADIEVIVAAHRAAPSVTLVPASVDGGTNALACSPPDAMPVCFGDHSLRRHREAARSRGIEPQVLQLEHLGHDIDRPADLATFLLRPSPTQSYAYLIAIGIAERLQRAHRDRRDESRAG
jgi:2-phospho-L-lactate guanylyltransferase